MSLDEIFTRFPANLTESAWWVSLFKDSFETLLMWDRYALAHPVGTIVYVVVLAVVALIARFVLKTMWRVVFYVLVPLAVALWLYTHVLRPLL